MAEADSILAPGGALATALARYEDRPQQRAMAAAVEAALLDERTLIVEAGTGTGKTLAYLIPAISSGKRVVVSTGTRTLQEQIARHDIPLLKQLLDIPFEAVTLKGVSNYVCRRRLHTLTVENTTQPAEPAFDIIRSWVQNTAIGDRAQLAEIEPSIPDDHPIWQRITTTPETRLGPRCPFFAECFVTQARRAAERADLILVNHHLFLADLSLRNTHPGARVLPDYDAAIFDEGHQLEETLTEHFGIAVSSMRTAQLYRDLRRELTKEDLFRGRSTSHGFLDNLARSSQAFFTLVRERLLQSTESGSLDRCELPRDLLESDAGETAWFNLDTALDEMTIHCQRVADRNRSPEFAEAAGSLARRAGRLRDDIATIAEQSRDQLVYWGEVRHNEVFLRGSPVEIGAIMREQLIAAVPATIITSATLSTGGSFTYLRRRLGLDEEATDELLVESPFDYTRQALLYIARDLPDPRDFSFTPACCDRIVELLEITEGRAFVLFTSYRALHEATRRLRNQLPYPLLVQGQEPRASLLERFRQSGHAVLLATGTFWEGVDVPGEALSQVIIDKLPFAPPNDPLTAARLRLIEEQGDDPFKAYQLPRAALALKQGFGRLIRRQDDRGIVALLDGRILSRRYGEVFLKTLPHSIPRTSVLKQVRAWWRRE